MNITDRVEIMITGMPQIHQAEVVRLNLRFEPYLQVLDETGWPILKPGDYIILGGKR